MLTVFAATEAVAKIDEPGVREGKVGGSGGLAYLFIHLPVACRPTSVCQYFPGKAIKHDHSSQCGR